MRKFLTLVSFLSLILLNLLFVGTVHAQELVEQPAAKSESVVVDPNAWKGILDSTEQALTREGLTTKDLDKLLNELAKVEQESVDRENAQKKDLTLLSQRLDSLGPKPKEGEPPESEETQKLRKSLDEQYVVLDAQVKLAAQTKVRTRQLKGQIGKLRNDRFYTSITARTPGLLSYDFWANFFGGFKSYFRSFHLLMADSATVFWKNLTANTGKILVLGFFLPIVGLLFIRANRRMDSLMALVPVDSYNVAVHGFAALMKQAILPSILLFSIYWIFSTLELLTSRVDQLFSNIILVVVFLRAFNCLAKLVLAPKKPEHRLARLSDTASKRIYHILYVGFIIANVIFILNVLAVIFISTIEVKVGLSLFFSLVVGVTGFYALKLYYDDRKTRMIVSGTPSDVSSRWSALLTLVWLVVIAIIGSILLGFISLSEFLSQQLLFGLVVILTAWLMLQFIDFLYTTLRSAGTQPADDTSVESGRMAVKEQALVLGSGIFKLLIYLLAAGMLLLPWGYRTNDFFHFVRNLFFGVEVGGLSISISTMLLAVVIFLIGYTVTVGLKKWLNNKYFPTTRFDAGISNSLSTVFGYAGVTIAAIMAISVTGFDLSQLAIVAGALSVGLGFGLQSIVNNFVSGLILLAERPIKAGDWVSTSGGDGYVSKISVRSTEIETFDRATIIVPNSSLITDTVTNWTHDNTTGRIILPIGVSYNADPDQVREILLKCAKEHKLVLGRPEPVVYFMDFADSSLNFQLRCFLANINFMLSVQSDLRFSILRAMKEANIEIPFPQRDLNIKNPEMVASMLEQGTDKPET